MSELKKTAIITGSARGIGKGIAMKLASAGFNIAIADVMENEIAKTVEEIKVLGGSAIGVKTDVAKKSEVEHLVATCINEFGAVDVLVNNAGITRDNLAIRMSEEEWDLVLNINLKGTFLCSQAAAKEMIKKRCGRIINIASVSGILGTAGQANYAASKAGVIALTKCFARELAARNITVNAIAPGFIQTEMTEKLPQTVKDAYLQQIPLKRAGEVNDIAETVLFLASDQSQYITGTVINVSGGLLIQ